LVFAVMVAALFAAPAPASAQVANPLPPAAATGAATNVALSTATVSGSVDPNGSKTTYYAEYGTTVAYGLRTAERSAGDGLVAVPVGFDLTGLTTGTTYHFRVVATNAAGIGRGADRTLTTTSPPRPLAPVVVTGGVRDLAPHAVVVTGTVNPRGQATRYAFEHGTGTSLNRRTALISAGAGTVEQPAEAALTLTPNTRYSYRLMATSSAGTVRGVRRSFTSPRSPAVLTFAVQSDRVPYEGTAVLTGTATSDGAGSVALSLERQPFPFGGPFAQIATTSSASDGTFRFTVSRLLLSARFRVVAPTTPAVTSVARTVWTTARIGVTATRRPGRRVRFSGEIRPVLNGGSVSLQRRKRGRFITLRRVNVRPAGSDSSTYRVTIAARRTAATFRLIVTPAASTGHARGVSRELLVRGLPGR